MHSIAHGGRWWDPKVHPMLVMRCLPYKGSGGEERRAFFGVLGTSTVLDPAQSTAVQRMDPPSAVSYYCASPQWVELEGVPMAGSDHLSVVRPSLTAYARLEPTVWDAFGRGVQSCFKHTITAMGRDDYLGQLKLSVRAYLFCLLASSMF